MVGIGPFRSAIFRPNVAVGDLFTQLSALDAAGKVVSAWVLPAGSPAADLTLDGSNNVLSWVARYGNQKVTLAEAVNFPAYDATAFNNKGGVVFSAAATQLKGTGNVVNWPAAADDEHIVAGVRIDTAGATAGTRSIFYYGDTGVGMRGVRRATTSSTNRPVGVVALNSVADTTSDASGAHTIGISVVQAGSSSLYFDGSNRGALNMSANTLTLTEVAMGTAGLLMALAGVVVLNGTATLQDFLNIEAALRARLS